jgi:hypothetical protein
MTLVAYSPLLNGAYARAGKKLDRAYGHPGTHARLDALDRVAKETGATVNQVVLAWLTGGELPVVALIGASSVAQLDESLAAADLQLTAATVHNARHNHTPSVIVRSADEDCLEVLLCCSPGLVRSTGDRVPGSAQRWCGRCLVPSGQAARCFRGACLASRDA